MTDTEKRMRGILTDTGLYSGEDKLFCAEMAAYGVGFALLEDAVKACREDLFIQTASDAMLEKTERLFRVVPSADDMAVRREMLLTRGSVTPQDNTKDDLEKQLLGAGMRAKIVERPDGLYVNVLELLGIPQEAAAIEAETFLPAHLPYVLDFGVNTWEAIDARGMTFDAMDGAAEMWNRLDLK